MTLEPPGPPPQRPKPGSIYNGENPKGFPSPKEGSMVWIVGPIVAILVFFCFVIVCCVARRRKQHLKTPLHHEQAGQHAMTPLMAGYDMNGGNGVIVSGLHAAVFNNHHKMEITLALGHVPVGKVVWM